MPLAKLYGNAVFTDSDKKFGTHSVKITTGGVGWIGLYDGRNVADDEEFTIEYWLKPTVSLSGQQGSWFSNVVGVDSVAMADSNSTTNMWGYFKTTSPEQFYLYMDNEIVVQADAVDRFSFNDDLPIDTWNHIAVTRDNINRVRMYINGKQVYSNGPLSSINNRQFYPLSPGQLDMDMIRIGKGGDINVANSFYGNYDEIRVTYGKDRYTNNNYDLDVNKFNITTDPYFSQVYTMCNYDTLPISDSSGETVTFLSRASGGAIVEPAIVDVVSSFNNPPDYLNSKALYINAGSQVDSTASLSVFNQSTSYTEPQESWCFECWFAPKDNNGTILPDGQYFYPLVYVGNVNTTTTDHRLIVGLNKNKTIIHHNYLETNPVDNYFTVEIPPFVYDSAGTKWNHLIIDVQNHTVTDPNGFSVNSLPRTMKVFLNGSLQYEGDAPSTTNPTGLLGYLRFGHLEGVDVQNLISDISPTWLNADHVGGFPGLKGYLHSHRLTMGISRYERFQTFTPPTQEFPVV